MTLRLLFSLPTSANVHLTRQGKSEYTAPMSGVVVMADRRVGERSGVCVAVRVDHKDPDYQALMAQTHQ